MSHHRHHLLASFIPPHTPSRLAKEKYVRVKKERDYHRMHHRRVLQEKARLLSNIKKYIYSPSLKMYTHPH